MEIKHNGFDKINVQEFDVGTIKDNSNILIIGQRGTGKSTITLNLIKHFEHIPIKNTKTSYVFDVMVRWQFLFRLLR